MAGFVNGLLGKSTSDTVQAQMQQNPLPPPAQALAQAQQASAPAPQGPPPGAQPPPEEAPPAPAPQQQPQGPPPQQVLSDGAMPIEEDVSGEGALHEASEEEDKQARVLLANIGDFIYGDGLPSVTKALKDEKKPVQETIGELTENMVSNQVEMAQLAEKDISPDILISVAAEVVNDMYTLNRALGGGGGEDDRQDQEDQAVSLNYAVNLYTDGMRERGDADGLQAMESAAQAVLGGEYDSQPGMSGPNSVSPGVAQAGPQMPMNPTPPPQPEGAAPAGPEGAPGGQPPPPQQPPPQQAPAGGLLG